MYACLQLQYDHKYICSRRHLLRSVLIFYGLFSSLLSACGNSSVILFILIVSFMFVIRHICDANNRHWRWWPYLWKQRTDCVQHPSWAALLLCWPQDRWKIYFLGLVVFNTWSFAFCRIQHSLLPKVFLLLCFWNFIHSVISWSKSSSTERGTIRMD